MKFRWGRIMKIKFQLTVLLTAIVPWGLNTSLLAEPSSLEPVKIGWIGPMTGPISKWGAYEAAQLALEEVNTMGGVNGRPLEVIFEDGKGNGRDAVSAVNKLLNVDRVKFILGGHCSPESLAIAPIVNKSEAVMLASITSSPFLSDAGDNVFRVTTVSTIGTEKVFEYARSKYTVSKVAVLYEEADYPRPQAERFRELSLHAGLKVVAFEGFLRDETDFRTTLVKLKKAEPDIIYLATISPDMAFLLLKQIQEMHLKAKLLGNENTGHSVNSSKSAKSPFEGLVFASSKANPRHPAVATFTEKYLSRFSVPSLPYGFYTAEPYDSLKLLAEVLNRCGDKVEEVKKCLYATRTYPGASGEFSLDAKGDAKRDYEIQRVVGGEIKVVE